MRSKQWSLHTLVYFESYPVVWAQNKTWVSSIRNARNHESGAWMKQGVLVLSQTLWRYILGLKNYSHKVCSPYRARYINHQKYNHLHSLIRVSSQNFSHKLPIFMCHLLSIITPETFSEHHFSKIFRGSMPPDPPRGASQRFALLAAVHRRWAATS